MAEQRFLTLKEASDWASYYLGRKVTLSNISYLIQYGRILRYDSRGDLKRDSAGITKVSLAELKEYYDKVLGEKQRRWEERLGKDINWRLGFLNVRESKRTKHVHRLHPYKGKFIPQLVEYFLDDHTDQFKRQVFFEKGATILDPFMGSGTTLVQCLELGLNSIGIDISKFNCLISRAKIQKYDLQRLSRELRNASNMTRKFSEMRFGHESDADIDLLISSFNKIHYPNPDFKILLSRLRAYQGKLMKEINKALKNMSDYENDEDIARKVLNHHEDETEALEKEIKNFVGQNHIDFEFEIEPSNLQNLVNEFTYKYEEITLRELGKEIRSCMRERQTRLSISRNEVPDRKQILDSIFLSTWFTERERMEMQYYLDRILEQEKQDSPEISNVMKIILSRTARSCRATKHVDLATLVEPQFQPYYCRKHFKICRSVTTIVRHLNRYTEDTIKRIRLFSNLRKNVFCEVINADSRTIDIFDCIADKNEDFYKLLERNKINGIFTSPPYVGQIDYHEQHAYAYELFNIERKDELEIGRMSNGVSQKAQKDYIDGISEVLLNVKKYLKENAHIFVVANDSKNLYPVIAKTSGLRIIDTFRRPVLNRTERDKQPYSESIFHMVFK